MRKIQLVLIALLFVVSGSFAQDIKGTYAIKNVKTGMMLRIKDANGKNGTPLVAYYPENWKCMTWDFKNTGKGTYQLQNLLTKKTFQPSADAAADVAFEEQPLVAEAANQQYEFVEVKKGNYLIKLKGTELYVTPSDVEGTVNSSIILAKKKDAPEQLWTIYKQNPTM
ncbi:hypothetical protein GCM10023149_11070 [Mucilaginibacter gynuensis]|uniref:Ricin B lectin domain-containing protein n=1 Tax=Mucilaginibacter gynuensis TaxID=1302236 RepID=A0ABP8G0X2_9SPHI